MVRLTRSGLSKSLITWQQASSTGVQTSCSQQDARHLMCAPICLHNHFEDHAVKARGTFSATICPQVNSHGRDLFRRLPPAGRCGTYSKTAHLIVYLQVGCPDQVLGGAGLWIIFNGSKYVLHTAAVATQPHTSQIRCCVQKVLPPQNKSCS